MSATLPKLSPPGARGLQRSRSQPHPDAFLDKESRVTAFVDRQMSHPGIEARRRMSQRQKNFIRERRDEEDIKFWGSEGRQGLKNYLITTYGSVLAGWRRLDLDQNGRLSYVEFCKSLRRLGYHGNLKKLWNELNDNGDNFITMMEIDPEAGKMVGMFKYKLMRTYGDMLSAWQKGLDVNGNGRIEEREVEACCKKLGLDFDTGKLWAMLRAAPSSELGLRLEDFDPDAHNRKRSGDVKGYLSTGRPDLIEDLPGFHTGELELPEDVRNFYKKGGLTLFRQDIAMEEAAAVQDAVQENKKIREPMNTAEGFRNAMASRFGSLMGAWRHALDPEGNEKLAFGTFCHRLRTLGYSGFNIQGLWPQLDVEYRGYIVFADLDPEVDELWKDLRSRLCGKYGNLALAWLRGLDTNDVGFVDKERFAAVCKDVGFPGNAARLFRLLQPDAGRQTLALWDFDPQAYRALARGDFRKLNEPEEREREGSGKGRLEMDLSERTEGSFTFQLRRAKTFAQQDPDFARACQLVDNRARPPPEIEQFDTLCTRKYGTLIGAWRLCLDKDANGKLTFNEFCDALRRLGYRGNFKTIWARLDADRNGYISLKELDPEADGVIQDFLELLLSEYGDLQTAWKSGFRKDPTVHLDIRDLRKLCKRHKYAHDVKSLFRCLQPTPGMRTFCLWDIHPLFLLRARATRRSSKVAPGSPLWTSPRSPSPTLWTSAASDAAEALLEEAATPAKNGRVLKAGKSRLSLRVAPEAFVVDTTELLVRVRRGLEKAYGSTLTAWRLQLDSHTKGFATQGNFFIALEKIAFHGNVKALWQSLTGGEDTLTFADLDPEAQDRLDTFRTLVLESFDTMTHFWNMSGAIARGGKISVEDFKQALRELELKVEDPVGLFDMFPVRLGQKLISIDDFQGVLVGVPIRQRDAVWGAALIPEERSKKEDIRVTTLEGFKKLLVVKFGSLFAAWRDLLDSDHNGLAKQVDFTAACDFLGLHCPQSLWATIDAKGEGQLRLEDLDPNLAEAFAEFESLLVIADGHVKQAWRRHFGATKTDGRVERAAFVAGCAAIGYSRDADELFDMLCPENGRSCLYYEDIWTNLNVNDFELKSTCSSLDMKSPLGSAKHRPKLFKRDGEASPSKASASPSQATPAPSSPTPAAAASPTPKAGLRRTSAQPVVPEEAEEKPAQSSPSPAVKFELSSSQTPGSRPASAPGLAEEAVPSSSSSKANRRSSAPAEADLAGEEPAQPSPSPSPAAEAARAALSSIRTPGSRPVSAQPLGIPEEAPSSSSQANRRASAPGEAAFQAGDAPSQPSPTPASPSPAPAAPSAAAMAAREALTSTRVPVTRPVSALPLGSSEESPTSKANRRASAPGEAAFLAATELAAVTKPSGPFDGTWTNLDAAGDPICVISEAEALLTWANGLEQDILVVRPILTLRDADSLELIDGTMQPSGEIHWSDGDVWTKLPAPAEAEAAAAASPAAKAEAPSESPAAAESSTADSAAQVEVKKDTSSAVEAAGELATSAEAGAGEAEAPPASPEVTPSKMDEAVPPASESTAQEAGAETADKLGKGEAEAAPAQAPQEPVSKTAEGEAAAPVSPALPLASQSTDPEIQAEAAAPAASAGASPSATVGGVGAEAVAAPASPEVPSSKMDEAVLPASESNAHEAGAEISSPVAKAGEAEAEAAAPQPPQVPASKTDESEAAAATSQAPQSSDPEIQAEAAAPAAATEASPSATVGEVEVEAEAAPASPPGPQSKGGERDVEAAAPAASPVASSSAKADEGAAGSPAPEATPLQASESRTDAAALPASPAASPAAKAPESGMEVTVPKASTSEEVDAEAAAPVPPESQSKANEPEADAAAAPVSSARSPSAKADEGETGTAAPQASPTKSDAAASVANAVVTVEALYDFDPATLGEWTLDEPPLPLKEGQQVEVVEDLGEWIFGQVPGKPEEKGYFPKDYVSFELSGAKAKDGTTDHGTAKLSIVEALYDFDPSNMEWDLDEAPLPLKEGQKVYVLEDEGEWILGRTCDEPAKEGFFPKSYVQSLDAGAADVSLPKSTGAGKKIVEVLYDFDPTNMEWDLDEPPLHLKEGDKVEVEEDGEEWILGRPLSDPSKLGWFPANYAEGFKSNKVILEAQFDFDPAALEEWPLQDAKPLALKEGDKVEVIDDDDSGWILGRLVNNPEAEGYFPKNYVE